MPTPDRARLKSRPGSPAQPAQPAANGHDASWLRLLVRDGSRVRCSDQWLALLGTGEELPDGLSAFAPLVDRLKAGELVSEAGSRLIDEAVRLWSKPGFDTFISLPRLRFTPFPYQLRAAEAALGRMRGRAILADEVGLGKTIEAGLVLSELYLRRLVQGTLIIVPAGLVEQWWEELDRKFGLPALAQGSQAWNQSARPWDAPIVIVSVATARRGVLREELAGVPWDLVVVDEAHRLKSTRSASARLARALRARYLLLLTATPVENRLDDLFQLVNLVRPGHLGSAPELRVRHGAAGVEGVREIRHLQARLRDVMVRHRRSEVALMLPRRVAETVRVAPGADEAELYRLVSERVRESATIGTIEDRILGVLERKINLFELVVGELDMILGRIGDDFDFESAVFRTHVESRDEAEFVERLEALGDDLVRARTGYRESRDRTDHLVGEGIVHE